MKSNNAKNFDFLENNDPQINPAMLEILGIIATSQKRLVSEVFNEIKLRKPDCLDLEGAITLFVITYMALYQNDRKQCTILR